jgi:hypothetical protein
MTETTPHTPAARPAAMVGTATVRVGTKPQFRDRLPRPAEASGERGHGGELDAIQALWDAYMALNATGTDLARGWSPGDPMTMVADAARAALALLPGVGTKGAREIWEAMSDNGDGARWNYDLWRKGEI